jgi:uncharacterized protein (DUF488 family)
MATEKPLVCFTFGHSEMSAEDLTSVLLAHDIDLVIDARVFPYNSYLAHFDRDRLDSLLHRNGISYLWMGKQLGCITNDGRLDSVRREREDSYQEGMTSLMELLPGRRVCVLSSESDWRFSHRHTLIAQTLLRYGIAVYHIESDGSVTLAPPDLFHLEEMLC